MSHRIYERRAEEAEAEAERSATPEDRAALLKIARLWRELAEGVARLQPPES